MTKLVKGQYISINDISKMPVEAASEKGILQKQGIKSTLVFPVHVKETLAGFIGFDSIKTRDDWNDNDLAALRMSSEICSNAIERQLATLRLAELIEELRSFNSQLEAKVEERTKQLAEALAGAKASSQAKSEFLASMSHELRTPLNAVIGFSQILQERYFGELNEKQAEYIGDIMDSGKHLLSLINDILDLSKIEAGKMEFEMSPLNLAELVRRSLVMVKEKALVHNIGLNVNVQGIESLEIKGDERRLKQVMFNLLSNSTKFTPDGGNITIDAKKDGEVILVSITDTGIGFKNRINQRFKKNLTSTQAIQWATNDRHTTKIGVSGGLGLALLKEFIEKNKGKIQIISDDGFYQFDSKGEDIKLFHGSFPGSIVNLQFRTDDVSTYTLADEVRLDDIF